MLKIIILVLIAEIVTVVGHILFKKSTNSLGEYSLRNRRHRMRFLSELFRQPALWLGMLAMILGLVIWLLAIASGDLSVVFPIGSLQYVLTLFMAHRFLGEKIDRMKAAGTLLVMLGIILIAMS